MSGGDLGLVRLEVSGGDFERRVRMRPIVADRRQFLVANGESLIDDGFPLLPTIDSPNWTVVLAAATAVQFERVRAHCRGPLDNPTYRPGRRRF